jgi:regulator of RNase E activity RraA
VKNTTAKLLDSLAAFDTPTICNVIELFEIRPCITGYMDCRIKAVFPELRPAVGYAATAAIRCSFPPHSKVPTGSVEEQVQRFAELPGSPIVVFQDLDDPPIGATFGEVMCSIYKMSGANGVITNGFGRDTPEIRRWKIPLFTAGSICSHGYINFQSVHTPVHVGGVVINPGDLIHADANGITTIPIEIATEIPDVAKRFVVAEDIVFNLLKTGHYTYEQLVEARKAMHNGFNCLKNEIHSRKPKLKLT